MDIEPGWQLRSKCRELSAEDADEMFFYGKGKRSNKAKEYCKTGCPVYFSCLRYALLYNEEGIWAGTTKQERNRVKPEVIAVIRKRALEAGTLEWRPHQEEAEEISDKQIVDVPDVEKVVVSLDRVRQSTANLLADTNEFLSRFHGCLTARHRVRASAGR